VHQQPQLNQSGRDELRVVSRRSTPRLAYAPDGQTVATASTDRTIRLWEVATMRILHQDRLTGWRLPSIAFSPDAASHLLAITSERAIHFWDVAHLGKARTIAIDKEQYPDDIAFSSDGTILAAGTSLAGAEIWLWRVSDGSLIGRLKSRKNSAVFRMSFSPDRRVSIAAGTSLHWERGIIRVFRLRDRREIQTIEAGCPWIGRVSFTPDGKQIVAGLPDTSIVIWDMRPAD
jgi:WD40 repeat protein